MATLVEKVHSSLLLNREKLPTVQHHQCMPNKVAKCCIKYLTILICPFSFTKSVLLIFILAVKSYLRILNILMN